MRARLTIAFALACVAGGAVGQAVKPPEEADLLAPAAVGTHRLFVIGPRVLELTLVTTKPAGGPIGQWDFVAADGAPRLPEPGAFAVTVAGAPARVEAVGFRRRVLYAPLRRYDLRIGNSLYLKLAEPVREGAAVEVRNPDGKLWAADVRFSARADRLRWSPALHVNQVAYAPAEPKRAMVGYYLGSLGEMDVAAGPFSLLDPVSGKAVYSGTLNARPDRGWTYATPPYQRVLEADFTAFRRPGEYVLAVPGLGVSLPFRIDEGAPAAFARAYALGLYHQRCGMANALPFTRFTHDPCHTAPAEVPTMANASVNRELGNESANYKSNPRHTAPQLKDVASSLYPFVRQGKIDVAGGHHDAGDYSKYTTNSAQLIHFLVFAADSMPGVGDLDNLGIPESGDGKSDVLQEAKWEADFLAKMQDEDGGFYFLVYPRDRAYEQDVPPDRGDPQVVFPKTTAATAAATAALAQAAGSPRFRREFPEAAARYLAAARKGWEFLERAWARYGMDGSYQKITHYGDTFMHDDEIAWAATELYLATGERTYHDKLLAMFDPSSPDTLHWGWERLFDAYGAAIRSYAFGAISGRVKASQLDPAFLAKCRAQILAAAQDRQDWWSANAYGTSFPIESKRFRTAGWYFSTAQAFDIAVAQLLEPKPERMAAILGNIAYEAGCNPTNVVFVTGLGWKRQTETVNQYALNDRRSLPPSGIPLGSIAEGFMYVQPYGRDLGALSFPLDGAQDAAYPMYDRWGDTFNVSAEFTIPIQGRALAVTAWLMAQSPLKAQVWRAAAGRIVGRPTAAAPGARSTVALQAEGLDLRRAQVVWEAAGNPPAYGPTFTFTPGAGPQWIEAEAVWPDGRRVFGVTDLGGKQ